MNILTWRRLRTARAAQLAAHFVFAQAEAEVRQDHEIVGFDDHSRLCMRMCTIMHKRMCTLMPRHTTPRCRMLRRTCTFCGHAVQSGPTRTPPPFLMQTDCGEATLRRPIDCSSASAAMGRRSDSGCPLPPPPPGFRGALPVAWALDAAERPCRQQLVGKVSSEMPRLQLRHSLHWGSTSARRRDCVAKDSARESQGCK